LPSRDERGSVDYPDAIGVNRTWHMRRIVFASTVMAITIAACTPSAWAGSPFNELTEAQKRKTVVPDIKALTYCVARQAANDSDAVGYYRNGGFGDYVGRQLGKCPRELNALLELYEETYGEGEAERFVKGPYLNDLPRAVLSVIRPQLDAKINEMKREEDATRQAEMRRQAAEDAQIAANVAEAKQREATANYEAEKQRFIDKMLDDDRKAAEAKAAAEKQGRIDTAMRAMSVLRDVFYECADRQLPGLVKSGETADVLASAAMTICSKPLADVQDAAMVVTKARDEANGTLAEAVLREQVKTLVKERVVADAVQAKAGVGAFATMSK
jgi:hypothetical protein